MPTATTSWQGGRREDEEKKEEGEKQPLIKSTHPHLGGRGEKELLKQMRNAITTKHETNEKHMVNKNLKYMSKNKTWLCFFFANRPKPSISLCQNYFGENRKICHKTYPATLISIQHSSSLSTCMSVLNRAQRDW